MQIVCMWSSWCHCCPKPCHFLPHLNRDWFYLSYLPSVLLPSVLWCCWLGSRKGIRPVKTEWWGAGMVICLERGADLYMAQLMPLPHTVSCFSKIQIGFTFVVPAHPGSPRQRAVFVCVCVCVCVCVRACVRACVSYLSGTGLPRLSCKRGC